MAGWLQDLAAEQKRTEELSKKLEDPGNQARWRSLQGEDPDLEQLSAKIQVPHPTPPHRRLRGVWLTVSCLCLCL